MISKEIKDLLKNRYDNVIGHIPKIYWYYEKGFILAGYKCHVSHEPENADDLFIIRSVLNTVENIFHSAVVLKN